MSPSYLGAQAVKNVSDILTLHLPETIRGWRLGRGELASVLAKAGPPGRPPDEGGRGPGGWPMRTP
ncbi:MAG: hypothetical protein ACTSP1_09490 [Candidatus Freyarchaeota archaeon]